MKLKLSLIILGLSCAFSLFSQQPVFSKLEINPNLNKFNKEFIGVGQRISVIFQNDSEGAEHTIEVFPEPPVIVRNHQTNTSCQIDEGGIWVRKHVYLSDDEYYLLFNEYSGSSEAFISYDTRTCEKLKRMDVSGLDWTIEGNQVHFKPLDLNFFVLPIN